MLNSSDYSFEAQSSDHPFRFKLVLNDGNSEDDLIIPGIQGKATVQIIDIAGHLIGTRETTGNISTDGLTPGVYVLRMITNDQVTTQKIMVR